MAISHRTNRLKVIGNPSVEQLQNGRYRLTFNMTPLNPRNDWYNANKSRIFADFGTLESAAMSVDGIDARTGETYTDMRLVAVESGNRSQVEGGDYIIQFMYETLGSSFVQTKDDTIGYELNGLRRVTRESIAAAGTDFQKTVGTTTITSQIDTETAVTCVLASYEVDDTDSYRKVTETYIEAGTISRTEDIEGSQKSIVLEVIGPDPSTPSGYALASKQESNFQGYQTNRFTFLKSDTVLSISEDKVGSQKALVNEIFDPLQVSPTPKNSAGSDATGYTEAKREVSNVDGIDTVRITFLKSNSVLSVSEDKIGSQNAITNEVFNPTSEAITGVDTDNVALSGYTEADRTESDYEGIKTIRVRFLKPSVLSIQEQFDVGRDRVSVRAFNMTSTEVLSDFRFSFEITGVTGTIAGSIDATQANQKYELLGLGEGGGSEAINTKVYSGATNAVIILSDGSNWVIDIGATAAVQSNGKYRVTGSSPPEFTDNDSSQAENPWDVQSWTRTGGGTNLPTFTQLDQRLSSNHLLIQKSEEDFEGVPSRLFVYELNSSERIDYELDGLKRLTRTSLSSSDFAELQVGSTDTASGMILANQEIDNGGEVKKQVLTFIGTGQVTLSQTNTQNLAGTFTRTYRSFFTEPTSNGILINKEISNTQGYEIYTYTFLEGSVAGSTPLGLNGFIESYQKNVQVRAPGVISASSVAVSSPASGNIAVLNVVPPTTKTVKATVTVSLETGSGSDEVSTPTAYNLSDVSASATITTNKISPIGIEQGSSLTVKVFNSRTNSQTRSFPNHYYSGTDKDVSYTTAKEIIRDNDNIIGETFDETVQTVISFSGTSSAPSTSGILSDEVDPVFKDASGNQYFRRVKYTV